MNPGIQTQNPWTQWWWTGQTPHSVSLSTEKWEQLKQCQCTLLYIFNICIFQVYQGCQ